LAAAADDDDADDADDRGDNGDVALTNSSACTVIAYLVGTRLN